MVEALSKQETSPGQIENILKLRKEIEAMSPIEIRRMLQLRKHRGSKAFTNKKLMNS
jgi:hypothetical protein